MRSVRIAELKAHLSEHLRRVRRGQPITALDRDTPIARIVPWGDGRETLRTRPATRRLSSVSRLPALDISSDDITDALREERQTER